MPGGILHGRSSNSQVTSCLLELPNPSRTSAVIERSFPHAAAGQLRIHTDSLFSLTESDQATAKRNHPIPGMSFRQPQWMVVAAQKRSAGSAAGQAAPQETRLSALAPRSAGCSEGLPVRGVLVPGP